MLSTVLFIWRRPLLTETRISERLRHSPLNKNLIWVTWISCYTYKREIICNAIRLILWMFLFLHLFWFSVIVYRRASLAFTSRSTGLCIMYVEYVCYSDAEKKSNDDVIYSTNGIRTRIICFHLNKTTIFYSIIEFQF